MSCLAILAPAGLVTRRLLPIESLYAAKESNRKQFCFQDKMCVRVKCSNCQKTTWKGKHVINSLYLVAEYLGG